jgi:hypothetical protein
MYLAFVRGCGAIKQCSVPFIQGDSNATHGECDGHTAALKPSAQDCDIHENGLSRTFWYQALMGG